MHSGLFYKQDTEWQFFIFQLKPPKQFSEYYPQSQNLDCKLSMIAVTVP